MSDGPKFNGDWLKDDLIRERQLRVMQMRRQNVPLLEIAKREGVCRQTVCKDLRAVRRTAIREFSQKSRRMLLDKLGELAEVKRQSWQEWERSKQDAERRTETTGGADVTTTTTRTIEGQTGNPAYMATIIKAIQLECELIGLVGKDRDAAEAGRADGPLVEIVVTSREQLAALRDGTLTFDGAGSLRIEPRDAENDAGQNGHHNGNGHNGNGHHNGDEDDDN